MTFDPFAGPGPRWYAVEPHRPFLEDLADGVLAMAGEGPAERLADTLVLLPNRRAARAFTEALSRRAAGRALLLPQVRPLGDLEEDEPPFAPGELGLDLPPAIDPLARRFEIARMVVEEFSPGAAPIRALGMADAFVRFLDSCQLEEIDDFERLQTLVPTELAQHWRESAEFLSLAAAAWPDRLKRMGLVDPAWRRARLLRLLAEQWRASPPQGPVIAAGSTGTAPAAADVLGAVAAAPHGCVVLPGLDRTLDPAVWAGLGEDEQHPQNALWRLLNRHGVERDRVGAWPSSGVGSDAERRGRARQRILSEALRPADATADWRGVLRDLFEGGDGRDPVAEGLEGLTVLSARHEEEAAASIALFMRETLETPGATCALVTPDLALGRRVAARLARWGVIADDSAGRPLTRTPVGRLLDLAARVLACPTDPHALLGLLKHGAVSLHLGEVDYGRALRGLEREALRGPRLRTWNAVRRKLADAARPRDGRERSESTLVLIAAAEALAARLEALTGGGPAPLRTTDEAARALTVFVEALSGPDVWSAPDGEAAAGLLSRLVEAGPALGAVSADAFHVLLRDLLSDSTVRTREATHPRLRIMGAIEARLVRADRMILAGLEEGVWPGGASTDPFLSRPMRQAMGLPPPERRLGQTAQDFVQSAAAPEVVLLHTERRGGQPQVRSRWLWRLEMLTRGARPLGSTAALQAAAAPLGLARALDAPADPRPAYARRPAPTPPVAKRPRELPVTGVERWLRDPYAVYARYVLGLRKLHQPGEPAEAMTRGTAVHAALQRVSETWPHDVPDDCAEQIELFFQEALLAHGFEEAAMAREAVLSRNCSVWLREFERERRAHGGPRVIEAKGEIWLPGPYAPFKLTARADRIELAPDGAEVIDFKTGSTPSKAQVRSHFAPQLTLTAAILAEGGFAPAAPAAPTKALLYVKVIGRKTAGEVCDVSDGTRDDPATPMQMADEARDGLIQRIAWFDQEDTPYPSWAAPQFMGRYGGDYDRLARVWEWHVVGAEDAEA